MLLQALSFKPGVGQNIATHASPTAKNVFLIPASRSIELHLFQNLSPHFFLDQVWLTHIPAMQVRGIK